MATYSATCFAPNIDWKPSCRDDAGVLSPKCSSNVSTCTWGSNHPSTASSAES